MESTHYSALFFFFLSSTNFTVPKGVKKIDCFCVGGGGCGSNNGGGGGYTSTKLEQSVTPGSSISVVVGAGGYNFDDGNTSSIGDICSANGGNSGLGLPSGGSGGGMGAGNFGTTGWDGGSDGNDGQPKFDNMRGTGQHSTTRYFGESNGTLYAGGGGGLGGIISVFGFGGPGGIGGAGGGGNGNDDIGGVGSSGAVNTGGGGGGSDGAIFPGGHGICIIRWSKQ